MVAVVIGGSSREHPHEPHIREFRPGGEIRGHFVAGIPWSLVRIQRAGNGSIELCTPISLKFDRFTLERLSPAGAVRTATAVILSNETGHVGRMGA
jgi:hypothetical protein